MSNIFDELEANAFGIVADTMGYVVTWSPLAGGGPLTATVLFKDADELTKMMNIEYDPQAAMIEYKIGDLPGLKESVDHNNEEILTINGLSYGVHKVKAKADGKTFEAQLESL